MNFCSERIIFKSLSGWLSFTQKAATWLLNGVFGVIFALIAAVLSLCYKIWTLFVAFVHSRPLLAVACVFVVMCVLSVVTFVNERAMSKMYEHQRDSIAYELMRYEETYCKKDSVYANDSVHVHCY